MNPGRPANTDAAVTRRRVLDAAARLFADHGEDGASVREIAKAAKVTGATVLHHFQSKERLYDASVEAMYDELFELQDRLAPALASGEDFDAILETSVRTLFRLAREHRTAIRLLLRHVVDTGEVGASRRKRALLPFLDTGAALFAARTGRSPQELRLVLQSAVFLLGRWAIAAPREVEAVAARKGAAAGRAVEDHLVDAIRRMVAP
jgi:AcrR family transcriptional regulator